MYMYIHIHVCMYCACEHSMLIAEACITHMHSIHSVYNVLVPNTIHNNKNTHGVLYSMYYVHVHNMYILYMYVHVHVYIM